MQNNKHVKYYVNPGFKCSTGDNHKREQDKAKCYRPGILTQRVSVAACFQANKILDIDCTNKMIETPCFSSLKIKDWSNRFAYALTEDALESELDIKSLWK